MKRWFRNLSIGSKLRFTFSALGRKPRCALAAFTRLTRFTRAALSLQPLGQLVSFHDLAAQLGRHGRG